MPRHYSMPLTWIYSRYPHGVPRPRISSQILVHCTFLSQGHCGRLHFQKEASTVLSYPQALIQCVFWEFSPSISRVCFFCLNLGRLVIKCMTAPAWFFLRCFSWAQPWGHKESPCVNAAADSPSRIPRQQPKSMARHVTKGLLSDSNPQSLSHHQPLVLPMEVPDIHQGSVPAVGLFWIPDPQQHSYVAYGLYTLP